MGCLLYTSDAADEGLGVDLGGLFVDLLVSLLISFRYFHWFLG